MQKLIALTAAVLAAGPVLAHGGAHIHPHGAESVLPLMLGAALIGVAGLIAWRSRR